jgi:hypothetical protein
VLIQSVLAVLSKQSTSSNVDMLVLRMVEGVDVSTSRDERGDSGVQEERDSIEARLIMKLHCKHGEFTSPTSLTPRRYQDPYPTCRLIAFPNSRS